MLIDSYSLLGTPYTISGNSFCHVEGCRSLRMTYKHMWLIKKPTCLIWHLPTVKNNIFPTGKHHNYWGPCIKAKIAMSVVNIKVDITMWPHRLVCNVLSFTTILCVQCTHARSLVSSSSVHWPCRLRGLYSLRTRAFNDLKSRLGIAVTKVDEDYSDPRRF